MTSGHPPRRRKSLRLASWDYGWAGAYFVTIVTHGRAPLFGVVVDGAVRLNGYGDIAAQCWEEIPAHFPHAIADVYVVMPNHVHGIVILDNPSSLTEHGVGAYHDTPLRQRAQQNDALLPTHAPPGSLGVIMRMYKGSVARRINQSRWKGGGPVWQRNYYEHIVRNERELNATREYILYNPGRWDDDPENPARPAGRS
jgi:putative transposase